MKNFNLTLICVFAVVACLLLPTEMSARPRSQEDAKRIAVDFVKSYRANLPTSYLKMAFSASPIVSHPQSATQKTYAKGADNEAVIPYFVYNLGNQKGFVIISGDDRTETILGYSDNSEDFSDDMMPDNLRAFLQAYEQEIQWVVDNINDESPAVPRYAHPTERINALCETKWGQDNPYNLYTPTVNNQNTPTGCVATAMAQVMYYHKWPQGATAEIPGYNMNRTSLNDLPSTTFDWENMTNTYNYLSSQKSKEAVAKLMQYCGWAVNMNYAPGGSGAYTMWFPAILSEYFGYGDGAKYLLRTDYSIGEWEIIMFNELKNNRPVIYTGYTAASEGHAFVCDGYDGSGLFHINWGWNGSYNGFFRLSVLNAGGTGTGGSNTSNMFSCGQAAVVGISSQNVTDLPLGEYIPVVSRPTITSGNTFSRQSTNDSFNKISFKTDFEYNNFDIETAYDDRQFVVGTGIYKDDNLIDVVNSRYITLRLFRDETYNATFSFGAGISEGIYKFVPVYRKDDNTWAPLKNADLNYIEANINGTSMSLAVVPRCDFNVTSAKLTNKNNLHIELDNPSEEYNGDIYLALLDGEDIGYQEVAIPAYSKDALDIYIDNPSRFSANTIYTLSVNRNGSDYFYINAENKGAAISKQVQVTNVSSDNASVVYGNKIGCQITLSNNGTGDYNHIVEIYLQPEKSSTQELISTERVDVEANKSVTLNVAIPVESKYIGSNYRIIAVHYDGKDKRYDQSPLFKVMQGVNYWTADGTIKGMPFSADFVTPEEALAVELRQGTFSSVTPNSNPNTIYMVDKTLINGLSGHNAINATGGTGSLRFVDGYDYIIPEQITVQKGVTYERVFSGETANMWQTISLPFKPVIITTDDETLLTVAKTPDGEGEIYLALIQNIDKEGILQTALSTEFIEKTPFFIHVLPEYQGKTITMKSQTKQVLTPDQTSAFTRNGISMRGTTGGLLPEGSYYYDGCQSIVKANSPRSEGGFHAYFTVNDTSLPETIAISFPLNNPTGIIEVALEQPKSSRVYAIGGQFVGNALPNKPGMYIVDGRKVIVK